LERIGFSQVHDEIFVRLVAREKLLNSPFPLASDDQVVPLHGNGHWFVTELLFHDGDEVSSVVLEPILEYWIAIFKCKPHNIESNQIWNLTQLFQGLNLKLVCDLSDLLMNHTELLFWCELLEVTFNKSQSVGHLSNLVNFGI
jgi:hypothetical protein